MPVRDENLGVVTTPRLRLAPAGMAEIADVAALHADERVWRHRPEGRHTSVEHTRSKVRAMEAQWHRDGLGYWVARLREPVADLPVGAFVGVGGCAVESGADAWNLYYRFRPEAQGQGLATELATAAVQAARRLDDRPVVARLAATNESSAATALRAGLVLVWRGPDPVVDGADRLIYADTVLDPEQLALLVEPAG